MFLLWTFLFGRFFANLQKRQVALCDPKKHSFIPGCFSLCTYLFWPQKYTLKAKSIQVNLFQKRSFMNQLTHNMTTDSSLIYNFLPRKIQIQKMLCTKNVLNAKTKTKNNLCTQHVLNLYFSCTELVIQWIISHHIVG